MRSDRNPYFFLKKSKDSWVQKCLADAATMSEADILKISKPDLRRAMIFVHKLGQQDKSSTTAELIADQMAKITPSSSRPVFEIWHYKGSEIELHQRRGSVILGSDFVFGIDQQKVFASHQWFTTNNEIKDHLIQNAVYLGTGDQNLYNKFNQENLSRKHVL
jgi:hypothetical protein